MGSQHSTRHGCARKGHRYVEYTVWANMIVRCCEPKSISYRNYGARGIAVCRCWRNDFAAFLADLGRRPSDKHSIDRIDNDGNYSCGRCEECLEKGWRANCRWATKRQQRRNSRQNRMVEWRGERRPLCEWAEVLGINYYTLFSRYCKYGWSAERTFATPVQQSGRWPKS